MGFGWPEATDITDNMNTAYGLLKGKATVMPL